MSPLGSSPCRRWRGGLCRSLCALLRSRTGNVAILFALLSIPMIGATGVAIDYARAQSMQTRLRSALDAAVLAGVTQEAGHQVDKARAVFALNVREPSLLVDLDFRENTNGSLTGLVSTDMATTVTALIGVDSLRVETHATAALRRDQNRVCILTLDRSASPGLLVNSGAEVLASDCEIHVRATGSPAATINALTILDVRRICVSGQDALVNGGARPPETGCNAIDDPFRGTLPTPSLSCTVSYPPPYTAAAVTLSPGTYCGDLVFHGSPVITLLPGIYVIRGQMMLNAGAVLRGEEVSLHFPDNASTLQANNAVRIELSAPTSGAFADILMSEPPGLPRSSLVINAGLGQSLRGLVYLPSRDLTVNAMTGASDAAALVVNTLILNEGVWRLDGGNKPMTTTSGEHSAYLVD
ncbi:TadE/TadG family type IV pilus assembly protein [Chelatococcus asaccharovorans]|uniref:Putative Flp pilus-assembly TadE/G-like protein n=1 Tax=Chelatococcus asaccharovorans TaxID=28210 RepID=A0A2V3U6G5_9HYPH|nr:TadE/TadG family type IV pilus assembly protein [Chelatococcus asaccharovorans]MBS7704176.1 pilus assembly protein [Chelatococcus asaccharovorans]PXW53197.1 putative Flp pilus-assembly TadE/G-like protein [Chelatococcus asaccharovorans]